MVIPESLRSALRRRAAATGAVRRSSFVLVFAEDNFVVRHCRQRRPGDVDWAGIDIFRLDEDGKVVEHQDVLQRVPVESANSNGMF
jgi:predicted SnoaL-like aldol condensation-catalyzing enzyme